MYLENFHKYNAKQKKKTSLKDAMILFIQIFKGIK